jgi:hypothetical protein
MSAVSWNMPVMTGGLVVLYITQQRPAFTQARPRWARNGYGRGAASPVPGLLSIIAMASAMAATRFRTASSRSRSIKCCRSASSWCSALGKTDQRRGAAVRDGLPASFASSCAILSRNRCSAGSAGTMSPAASWASLSAMSSSQSAGGGWSGRSYDKHGIDGWRCPAHGTPCPFNASHSHFQIGRPEPGSP